MYITLGVQRLARPQRLLRCFIEPLEAALGVWNVSAFSLARLGSSVSVIITPLLRNESSRRRMASVSYW